MSATSTCPVCAASGGVEFLRRDAVPVHQNLLHSSREAALDTVRGNLAMHVCGDCGFVHNAEFDPARMSYGEHYDNAQEHSGVFQAHVERLARRIVEERGVRRMHIVEVGCGSGSFLRRLVQTPGADNTGTGFDPSYTGPLEDLDGRLRFRREYYGPGVVDAHADAVVCRHVIEHVPAPMPMLRALREVLGGSPQARVFFETPCVEWIFRERASWDFFYEHCSLFSRGSLARAFADAGFDVSSVDHVFGGQYLWLEATPAAAGRRGSLPQGLGSGTAVAEAALAFGEAESARVAAIVAQAGALAAHGRTALWGAGAKGCTLALLADPEARLLDGVIDINPAKQGCHVAGTGHPIVSPAEAARRGVRQAFLMNPNYRQECEAILRQQHIDIQLLEFD